MKTIWYDYQKSCPKDYKIKMTIGELHISCSKIWKEPSETGLILQTVSTEVYAVPRSIEKP